MTIDTRIIERMTDSEKMTLIVFLQTAHDTQSRIRQAYEAQCELLYEYIRNTKQIELADETGKFQRKKISEFMAEIEKKYQTIDEEFEEDLPFTTIKPEEEDKNP